MNITKQRLKQIIKEEMQKIVKEEDSLKADFDRALDSIKGKVSSDEMLAITQYVASLTAPPEETL